MPKITNKGFGGLPILILMLSLSVLSFVGYQYYLSLNTSIDSESLENNSEDVLQAMAENQPRDLSTFLYRNLFDSENLAAFNKNTTGLIVTMSEELDRCFFVPRGSKPLTVRYKYQGKNYSARIYQQVSIQILPKSMSAKKYAVVIPSANAEFKVTENISIIRNSCGANVYMFEQPSEEINASNFSNFIVNEGSNSGGNNPSTAPGTGNPVPGISYNAEIVIVPGNRQTTLRVTPKAGDMKANQLIHDYFRNRGIVVTLQNGRTVPVKATTCASGGCANGFTMRIPQDVLYKYKNVELSSRGGDIEKIALPYVNNSAEYEVKAEGRPCDSRDGSLSGGGQVMTYKNFVIQLYQGEACLIGMNNQN